MSPLGRRFSRFVHPASVFSLVSALAFPLAATVRAEGVPLPASRPEAPPMAGSEAPPMAGHDAEARMRSPDDEVRWRRLHFDPASREIGEAGVSCDHRRLRRPETIRGLGAVAIATDRRDGHLRLRLWAPPSSEPAPDPAAVEAALRRHLADSGVTADVDVEMRVFAWCR